MRKFILGALLLAVVVLTGCSSKADTVDKNLGREAEAFHVQRRIVAINGITDKVLFEVVGRCSIEYNDAIDATEIICKYGPHDFRKHFFHLSDNVTYVSTQLQGLDVSEYHTEVILRPSTVIPDVKLDVGG